MNYFEQREKGGALIIIIIILVIVVAAGLFLTRDTNNFSDNVSDQTINDQRSGSIEMNDDTDDVEEDVAAPGGTNAGSSGSFEDFSPEKISRAANGDVLLFFHANWCPSCRVLEDDINKNSDKIPGDLTILKVDYDKETDLKAKYGVRLQHTIVQVDENGDAISAWAGGNRLVDLVSSIK